MAKGKSVGKWFKQGIKPMSVGDSVEAVSDTPECTEDNAAPEESGDQPEKAGGTLLPPAISNLVDACLRGELDPSSAQWAQTIEFATTGSLPAETVTALGEVLIKQEAFTEALRVLSPLSQAADLNEWGCVCLGNAYRGLEQWSEAAEWFGEAISRNPAFHWSQFGRGVALHRLGEHDAAVAYLERAVELEPKFYWAWYELIHVYTSLERIDDALNACGRCEQDESVYHAGRVLELRTDLLKQSGRPLALAEAYQVLLERDMLTEHDVDAVLRFAADLTKIADFTALAALTQNLSTLIDAVEHGPRIQGLVFDLLFLRCLATLLGFDAAHGEGRRLIAMFRRHGRFAGAEARYHGILKDSVLAVIDRLSMSLEDADGAGERSSQSFEESDVLNVAEVLLACYQDVSAFGHLVECVGMSHAQHEDPGAWSIAKADALAIQGRHGFAFKEARSALKHYPESVRALARAGQSGLSVLEREADLGRVDVLATKSVKYLRRALDLQPARSELRQHIARVMVLYVHKVTELTRAMASHGELAQARTLREQGYKDAAALAKVLTITGDSTELADPGTRFDHRGDGGKVIIVGTTNLPQCYHYRVAQKVEQATTLRVELEYLDGAQLAGLHWQSKLSGARAIMICRLPASFNVLRLIAYAKSLGLRVLYDIDDLGFDHRYFPAALDTYAGTIDKATHEHLYLDNPFFSVAMQQCDDIIVSTPPLVTYAREIVGDRQRIWVHPNAIGSLLDGLGKNVGAPDYDTGGEPVRLFYGSATKAHKQVFYDLLAPALARVLAQRADVMVEFVGYFKLPEELLPFEERIIVREPLGSYAEFLRALQSADISLSVLEDNPFTDCKSEIKWLEAAVFGIPSVVTPTAAYRALAETSGEGTPGFLTAATVDEWAASLTSLIDSADLRERIGQRAKNLAYQAFGPRVASANLQKILNHGQEPPAQPVERQRLLVVNVFYKPQSIGGATRVVEAEIKELQRQFGDRFEIEVLCTDHSPNSRAEFESEQYIIDDVLVTRLYAPLRDWADHHDTRIEAWCREFFVARQYDLIHFHCVQILTASPLAAAITCRIPYCVTVHDGWWLSRHQFLVDNEGQLVDAGNPVSGLQADASAEQMMEAINRRNDLVKLLGRARKVIAVSDSFAALYRDATGLGNIVSVPNAVEPLERLERVPPQSGRVRVAHIGGMSAHKGYDLFRDAVIEAESANIEVIVVDHTLAPGESYDDHWGTTPVSFIAPVPQSQINTLLARIDVLVAPSIWPESFGLVTREALMAGVWVIASDRGAIGEPVEPDRNGWLVSVDNTTELVERLRLLENDAIAGSSGNPDPSIASGAADRTQRLVDVAMTHDW